jgi:hydroxymethylglutaryl-CoA lyase
LETGQMSEQVKIVECPRDSWQGLPMQIAPEVKANYLRKLVEAGFSHIDAVSFVSPLAVPQMADSERVLELLGPQKDVEIIAIVVNEKGAERAIRTEAVNTLGFPYSISAEFLRRNQHQTMQESLSVLQAVLDLAVPAGLNVVAYLSMAFGNPYDDSWSVNAVLDACTTLAEAGVLQLSLADTVGLASPQRIGETVAAVRQVLSGVELGVHLHARRDEAEVRIRAAYHAGCRRFDSAIGGLGGCPFAQDQLVGNLPTETLLSVLAECGATVPEFAPLDELVGVSARIAASHETPVR